MIKGNERQNYRPSCLLHDHYSNVALEQLGRKTM